MAAPWSTLVSTEDVNLSRWILLAAVVPLLLACRVSLFFGLRFSLHNLCSFCLVFFPSFILLALIILRACWFDSLESSTARV